MNLTIPTNSNKRLTSILTGFQAKVASADALTSRLDEKATALDAAKTAVQLDASEENLAAYSRVRGEFEIMKSTLHDVGYAPRLQAKKELEDARQRFAKSEKAWNSGTGSLDDLESARREYAAAGEHAAPDPGSEKEFLARHLETPDFFTELKSSLEELQKRFQKSAHTARQRLASCVSELIMEGKDFSTFDNSDQSGRKASRAKAIVDALESQASEIGKAITKTRARATGSHSTVTAQELLSYLNHSPEAVTARFDLK